MGKKDEAQLSGCQFCSGYTEIIQGYLYGCGFGIILCGLVGSGVGTRLPQDKAQRGPFGELDAEALNQALFLLTTREPASFGLA